MGGSWTEFDLSTFLSGSWSSTMSFSLKVSQASLFVYACMCLGLLVWMYECHLYSIYSVCVCVYENMGLWSVYVLHVWLRCVFKCVWKTERRGWRAGGSQVCERVHVWTCLTWSTHTRLTQSARSFSSASRGAPYPLGVCGDRNMFSVYKCAEITDLNLFGPGRKCQIDMRFCING